MFGTLLEAFLDLFITLLKIRRMFLVFGIHDFKNNGYQNDN